MELGQLWPICTQGAGSGILIMDNPLKKHHYYIYFIRLDHGEKLSDSLIIDLIFTHNDQQLTLDWPHVLLETNAHVKPNIR